MNLYWWLPASIVFITVHTPSPPFTSSTAPAPGLPPHAVKLPVSHTVFAPALLSRRKFFSHVVAAGASIAASGGLGAASTAGSSSPLSKPGGRHGVRRRTARRTRRIGVRPVQATGRTGDGLHLLNLRFCKLAISRACRSKVE